MRTTITMDEDVAAAVEQFRHARHVGVSAAVNELIRRGLIQQPDQPPFKQDTSSMRARIDVANIAEALEYLDGPVT